MNKTPPSHPQIYDRKSTTGTIHFDNNQLLNVLLTPSIFCSFRLSFYYDEPQSIRRNLPLRQHANCIFTPLHPNLPSIYPAVQRTESKYFFLFLFFFFQSLLFLYLYFFTNSPRLVFISLSKSSLHPLFLPPMKLTAAGEHRVGLDIKSPWSLDAAKSKQAATAYLCARGTATYQNAATPTVIRRNYRITFK